MSSATVKSILTKIGQDLPNRERVPFTKATRVKMEPQGTIWVTHGIDTYREGKVDISKNNLEGKKLVLLFGRESHFLTRGFLVPKMSVIYQNITLERKDIEFLYVGLDGQTKKEYDRFAASMRESCCSFSLSVPHGPLSPLKKPRPVSIFYTPLKKSNGTCSVAILAEDHETVINPDGEPKLQATHDDTGKDFPWQVEAAETCCAAASTLAFCTIM